MTKRTFEGMVSYFNQTVADMDIDRKYKIELLGMITAILQRHDEDMKHAQTIEEGEAEKRRKDRQELHEMFREIEPAKNEDIARRAIGIADYYLVKAENQARHIQDLEGRYRRTAPCDVCRHNPPSSGDGKPCCMCPAEKAFWKEGADG